MRSLIEQFESVKDRTDRYGRPDTELTDEVKRMVMASCDVRGILESWGVNPVLSSNGQWSGYCPDHVRHDGHPQHLPKWTMKADTGDCYCFTSSIGSNFVYVAKRLYGLDTVEETIRALTGGQALALPPPAFVVDDEAVEESREREIRRQEDLAKGVALVERLLADRHLSDECLEYFANDGITKDTLDALGVCSVESGWLEGRAVVPFVDAGGQICGYVAINYLGKDGWIRRQYDKLKKADPATSIAAVANSYRKTLYCSGFSSGSHLYGLHECLLADGPRDFGRLVVVEGERDAMKLLQEGIECVSVHGTSIKDEQRNILKSLNPSRLYLGFDMDKAGCKAQLREHERLFPEMESVLSINFPDGRDPKRFGSAELERLLADADVRTNENLMARKAIMDAGR